MSQDEVERRQDEAEDHIRATVMKELCEVMHRAGLPPMAALRLAARSIGAIYREMADAHTALTGNGTGSCPCGWHPHNASDVEMLATALTAACERRRREPDLRLMRIAGTA